MKIKIMRSFCTLIILLTSTSNSFANQNNYEVSLYGYMAYKFAILNSVGIPDPPNDASGLIVFLAHVDNNEARTLLVELTSLYIGSATGEALSYSIVKQGDKILPELKKSIDDPEPCVFDNLPPSVRCLPNEQRIRRVNKLIQLIESGEKIEYVI